MITNVSYPDISQKKIRGFSIPSIGLGTHNLKGKDCQDAVIKAILQGYRHIDTAQAYGNEADIGQAIIDMGFPREKLFITDKIWFDQLKYDRLMSSFDKSLNRLKTDYIDLLLIHWPDPNNPRQHSKALSAMRKLRRKGRIKAIGVSNFTPRLMKDALTVDDIIANEIEYHPYLDQRHMLDLTRTFNFFIIAYAPLAQSRIFNDATLKRIGEKYHKNEAQVTLRWLIQQYNVVAIPRSSKIDHIKSNIELFDFELTDDEMEEIGTLSNGTRLVNPEFAPAWGER